MIDRVDASLDELYTRVWNDYIESDQPAEVFHYTSAEGLCGILTKKLFFASDLFCLQDPSEFQYGKEVLISVLRTRSDAFSKSLLANLSEHPLFPHKGKNWSVYSVSFCGTKDLLGQWRGYGGTAGYAVGVRLASLLEHPARFAVLRMLYDPGKQEQVFHQLVSGSTDVFEDHGETGREDELLTQIGSRLVQSIFSVKHPAFRGEDEWRILMLEPFDNVEFPVHFRVSGARIVPYVGVPFETSWISTVVLGPTAARYPNEAAIMRMLTTGGFDSAKCEPSVIPLNP